VKENEYWVCTRRKIGRSIPHEIWRSIGNNWLNLLWRMKARSWKKDSFKIMSGIWGGCLKIYLS